MDTFPALANIRQRNIVLCEPVHAALARLSAGFGVGDSALESVMRQALYVAIVLAGVLSVAIAAPATKAAFHNHVMVDGLYVALPTEMHNFPVELVAEP
jgi:hypothetical protein